LQGIGAEDEQEIAMSRRPIQASIRTHAGDGEFADGVRTEDFREAMSLWASGVAILAASDGDDVEAITASAVTSLSVDPPLVLVCIGNHAAILPTIHEQRRFVINLLAEGDRRLASDVALRVPPDPSRLPASGDPVLEGALASLVCRLWETYPGGDHQIVIGQVERVEIGADAAPLVHFAREYRALR
jgi:flavin reductase (NADH)